MPRFLAWNLDPDVTIGQLQEALGEQLVLQGVRLDPGTLRPTSAGADTLEIEFELPEEEADLVRGSMGQGRTVYLGRIMEVRFTEITPRLAAGAAIRSRMLYTLGDHLSNDSEKQWRVEECDLKSEVYVRGNFAVAEIVMECVYAMADVATLPVAAKAIVCNASIENGGWLHEYIGRYHQPEFFERLVPDTNYLRCVSGSHFEVIWAPRAPAATLRRDSSSGLLIDDRPLGDSETEAILRHGSLIGFSAFPGSDEGFLVLRVNLRSEVDVSVQGPHPASALRSAHVDNIKTVDERVECDFPISCSTFCS